MDPILRTHSLEAFYGDAQALFGIDFELFAGELVAIIGANGAGKSTFLKCLTGLIKVPRQAIHLKGQAMGGLPTGDIVKSGLTMVPEGRYLEFGQNLQTLSHLERKEDLAQHVPVGWSAANDRHRSGDDEQPRCVAL